MHYNEAEFRIKRGRQRDLRTLDVGEPAFATDTKKLFIGTGTENVEVGGAGASGALVSDRVYSFETVADLKATTFSLSEGDMVATLGFHKAGDGGAAFYRIGVEPADGYFHHELPGGVTASLLIYGSTVNIKQIGAKPQDRLGKYDTKPFIDAYIRYLDRLDQKWDRCRLHIPSGIWCFSPTDIWRWKGFSITGDPSFIHKSVTTEGTVLTSLTPSQRYVIRIGINSGVMHNFEFGDFTISSAQYVNPYENTSHLAYDGKGTVTEAALIMQGCSFGFIRPIAFIAIHGTAIKMTSSWEITVNKLIFRSVTDYSKPVVRFAEALYDTMGDYGPNLSNNTFEVMDFEECCGDYIHVEARSYLINSDIKTIIGETSYGEGETVPVTDPSFDPENAVNLALLRIEGEFSGTMIQTIALNNFSWSFAKSGGKQYVYDTVLYPVGELYPFNVVIQGILIHGIRKNYNIVLQKPQNAYQVNSPNSISKLFIANIVEENQMNNLRRGIFNVQNFPAIKVGNMRYGDANYDSGFLSPSMLAFHEIQYHAILVNNQVSYPGKLRYDTGTLNPLNLAVVPLYSMPEDMQGVARFFYDTRNTIRIRAKVPAGSSNNILNISGTLNGIPKTKSVTLPGRGSYMWYDIVGPGEFDDNTYVLLAMDPRGLVYFDVLQYR